MNKFDWKNKNLWLGIIVILIIILIISISKNKSSVGDPQVEELSNTEDVLQVGDEAKPVTSSTKKKTTSTTSTASNEPKLGYQDAIVKYKDFRIQFDDKCRAIPSNVTYKNGTEIMIDNRSPINQKFFVDKTFTVAPYDYQIVKLTSTTFPKTFLVDCGQMQNVATILLQK